MGSEMCIRDSPRGAQRSSVEAVGECVVTTFDWLFENGTEINVTSCPLIFDKRHKVEPYVGKERKKILST